MRFRFFSILFLCALSVDPAAADEIGLESKCLIRSIYYLQKTTDFLQFSLDQELLSGRSSLTKEDILQAIPDREKWSVETEKYSDFTGDMEFLNLKPVPGKKDDLVVDELPYSMRLNFDSEGGLIRIEDDYKPCENVSDVKISDENGFLVSQNDLLELYEGWFEKARFVRNISILCGCIRQQRISALAMPMQAEGRDIEIERPSHNLYQRVVSLGVRGKSNGAGQLTIMQTPVDDGVYGFVPLSDISEIDFNIGVRNDGRIVNFLPYHER